MSDNKNTNAQQESKTVENKTSTPQPAIKPTVAEQAAKVFTDKQNKKEEPRQVVINAKYLANVPSSAYPVINNLDKLKEDIYKNGTDAQRNLVSSLEKYIAAMKPGVAISGKDGALKQYSLWRAIKRILEVDPFVEFKGLWTILLAYVKENVNGCFAHTHRYRFTEHWTKSQAELDGLNNILNLLVIGCEDNARLGIDKEVRLEYTLLNGFKDEARKRVFSYYGNV